MLLVVELILFLVPLKAHESIVTLDLTLAVNRLDSQVKPARPRGQRLVDGGQVPAEALVHQAYLVGLGKQGAHHIGWLGTFFVFETAAYVSVERIEVGADVTGLLNGHDDIVGIWQGLRLLASLGVEGDGPVVADLFAGTAHADHGKRECKLALQGPYDALDFTEGVFAHGSFLR